MQIEIDEGSSWKLQSLDLFAYRCYSARQCFSVESLTLFLSLLEIPILDFHNQGVNYRSFLTRLKINNMHRSLITSVETRKKKIINK